MSEKLIDHKESAGPRLELEAPEQPELLTARAAPEALAAAEKDQSAAVLKARQEIRTAPATVNRFEQLAADEAAPEPSQHTVINRQLKQITLRHGIKQLQSKETRPERILSRLIHQPAVRVVSEVAGRTVSRPSGLLGGSLMAFAGTSGYLYAARHYGLAYNYLVFLLLLAAGFALGLVLELLVHLATIGRRQSD
jgi:hypothetical protein